MTFRSAAGNNYDAIVVGGDVGGLVAAAYLARARARVLLLEAGPRFGGNAETMGLASGVRAPLLSHLVWALDPAMVRSLRLASHGLEFAQPNMKLVALRPGGKHMVLPQQSFRARTSHAAQAGDDGDAYVAFHKETTAFARRMRPLWSGFFHGAAEEEPEQTLPSLVSRLRLSDRDAARLDAVSRLSAASYLDRWFENDALKAALSFDVFPSGLSPLEAGSALALIWRYAQESCGRQAAVSQLRGGPGALVRSLEAAARLAGAELRSATRVASIIVEKRRAVGVTLDTGEMIAASAVLSTLDQRRTLLDLVPAASVGFATAMKVGGYQKVATAQIVVTLGGVPPVAGLERGDLDLRFVLAEWTDVAALAKNAALAGNIPTELALEMTVPTVADPSLAPGGQHVLSVLVPFVPAACHAGWDARREPLGKHVLAALEAVAPGLKDRVVAVDVLTPHDIATRTGGVAAELGSPWSRLLASYETRIRTPIAGLYLCGNSAEPVNALSGRAGRLAADLVAAKWRYPERIAP